MDLTIEHSNVLTRTRNSQANIVINRGGTRSTKTVSMCQLIAGWLFTGVHSKHLPPDIEGRFTITRKFAATISKTVQDDWLRALNKYEPLLSSIKVNMTERTYKFGKREVMLLGADDQQKLRGFWTTHLYANEGNELDFKNEWFQLSIRTTGRKFIDFNPDDEDVWINTELEQKRASSVGDVDVIVSNYLDNPFLSEAQVKEIELLRITSPDFWKIYGLGDYGSKRGRVFEDFSIIPELPKEAKLIGHGGDFGYTNDPTTLVSYYEHEGSIYLDEQIFERGLTNPDIAAKIRSLGINPRDIFVFDSAEQKSIEELYRHGLNVYPAIKGKDSINAGIDVMKQRKIFITARALNMIKEFKGYKYLEDKNGITLNKPADINNHTIDAARYIITWHRLRPNVSSNAVLY